MVLEFMEFTQPRSSLRLLVSTLDSFFYLHLSPFRQASRTDSIYTLRPAGPNYKRSVFCFGRKKSDVDEAEAKHRTVVPNHTGNK